MATFNASIASELSHTIGGRSLEAWSNQCAEHMRAMDSQFDPGHRFDHLQRVFNNVMQLHHQAHADLSILVPALWLHDCLPIAKNSPQRSQASQLSAQQAIRLLTDWQYPQTKLPAIQHAIEAHSFSANITPTTLEAQVLQDADRLDSLGAIGIARTFMVGGKLDGDLYHLTEPFPHHRAINDKQYVIDHFYQKLLTLHESFQTQAGREEAIRRTKIMKQFLDHFHCDITLQ